MYQSGCSHWLHTLAQQGAFQNFGEREPDTVAGLRIARASNSKLLNIQTAWFMLLPRLKEMENLGNHREGWESAQLK